MIQEQEKLLILTEERYQLYFKAVFLSVQAF